MEDFVTFELAKKLKEKGYPQRPDYFNYSSYYNWDGLRKIHSLNNASVWFDPNISRENIYFAPTISQVLKWLREEKNIVFGISPMQEMDCDYLGWCVTIYKVDDNGYGLSWQEELYCDTYESAANAGIEYAVDNILKKEGTIR